MNRSYSPLSNDDHTCSSPGCCSSPEVTDAELKRSYMTSEEHVKLVCENLINTGKFERLETFLWAIPNIEDFKKTEIVLIAQCYLAFRKGSFNKVYELLQRKSYSKKYHRQLQYLWRTARYIEAERARGRALGSVGKYRIRRKYPLPYTIWDGECMSYCFREEAREILNAMYKRSPYPTAKEKYAIAQEAKLSVTQVSNWFKNKRQRARAKTNDKKDSLMKEAKEEEKILPVENHLVDKEEERRSPKIIETDRFVDRLSPRKPIPQLHPFLTAPYKRKLYTMPYPYPVAIPMMTKYRYVPTPVLYKMPPPTAHHPSLMLVPNKKLIVENFPPKHISPPYYHRYFDKLCDICMNSSH